MNNVKLLLIKCCFFQIFSCPVALKNKKKFCPPQEKVEMTLLAHSKSAGSIYKRRLSPNYSIILPFHNHVTLRRVSC